MMDSLTSKYAKLGVESAPGQEDLQVVTDLPLRGEKIWGEKVDFSHGDIDAHEPTPGSLELFTAGYKEGTKQAYTEYRGRKDIREYLANKLAEFTGAPINYETEILLTPGTQGALFLAMGALTEHGTKVGIVEPDYFANRKLVEFFDGEIVPINLDYMNGNGDAAGLNLKELEEAFANGVKVFLFSNPNNPTGVIYSEKEIKAIAELAKSYGVTLIVDELYSRQIFDNHPYVHLRSLNEAPENIITILGPSKTESLSGYRLGTAFGSKYIIDRMEKLQAIVSLRCSGYNQAVFRSWFNEPDGFMLKRIQLHSEIRDEILALCNSVPGVSVRKTEGGSYLFITLPEMDVNINQFCKCVRLLTNVIITPGTEFGPQFTHHFRINFSQDKDKAISALKRVFELFERYRKTKKG